MTLVNLLPSLKHTNLVTAFQLALLLKWHIHSQTGPEMKLYALLLFSSVKLVLYTISLFHFLFSFAKYVHIFVFHVLFYFVHAALKLVKKTQPTKQTKTKTKNKKTKTKQKQKQKQKNKNNKKTKNKQKTYNNTFSSCNNSSLLSVVARNCGLKKRSEKWYPIIWCNYYSIWKSLENSI